MVNKAAGKLKPVLCKQQAFLPAAIGSNVQNASASEQL
jgi:hypothetical protein